MQKQTQNYTTLEYKWSLHTKQYFKQTKLQSYYNYKQQLKEGTLSEENVSWGLGLSSEDRQEILGGRSPSEHPA